MLLVGICACDKVVPVESGKDGDILEESQDQSQQGQQDPSPDMPDTPVFYPQIRMSLTDSEAGLRNASNLFGLKVFQKLLIAAEGDAVFSPLSLSLALAMSAEGAEGNTYKQFVETMGWENATRQEIGSFYEKMIAGLAEADKSVLFSSSNSLWVAEEFRLKESYASALSKSFAAESFSVDFSLPATLERINAWCSEKTDGKIPQLLDALEEQTKLLLINALLFEAPWGLEWDVKESRDFHGSKTLVPKDYLYADGSFSYRDLDDFEIVGVPYGNGAYEIDILLPKAGKVLQEILQSLDLDVLRFLHTVPVELYIPKFSIEFSTEDFLPAALKDLGLTLPFQADVADFSRISDERLFLSTVLQKTKLEVSEKGTGFAAATVVVGVGSANPGGANQEKVVVDANRPFAYCIRETSSNAVLLFGTLSD